MTNIGLRRIVNGDLINRFSALTNSGGDAGSRIQNALSGGSATTFSSTLRTGAQVYSQAVQGLNATISFLNVTRDSLAALREVTTDLIGILERATSPSAGRQTLTRLQDEFDEKGAEFREIVAAAEVGGRQYLSEEGLKNLFLTVGFDPEQSDSLSELFGDLVLATEKDTSGDGTDLERFSLLASEKTRAPRPVRIPASAFGSTQTIQELGADNQISLNDVDVGGSLISDVNTVYADSAVSGNGLSIIPEQQLVAGLVPGLSSNVNVFDTNTSGYSIVSSTEDFMGFNASNLNQLYVSDEFGNIVHQITNNASATVTYGAADFNDAGTTFAYIEIDGGVDYTAVTASVASQANYGNPTNNSYTTIESTTDRLYGIKIDEIGANVAYTDITGDARLANIGSPPTFSIDFETATSSSQIYRLDFSGANELVLGMGDGSLRQWSGASTTSELFDSGFGGSVLDDLEVDEDAGLVVASNLGTGNVTVFDLDAFATTTLEQTVESSVNLSVVAKSGQVAYVGVSGVKGGEGVFTPSVIEGIGDGVLTETSDPTATSFSDVSRGFVSAVNNVIVDEDIYNGYNPSFRSLITESRTGIAINNDLTAAFGVTVGDKPEILASDPANGRFIIESTDDFFGLNSDSRSQLFLVDAAGRPVQQITNAEVDGITYKAAAVNGGSLDPNFDGNIAIAFIQNDGTNDTIQYGEFAAFDSSNSLAGAGGVSQLASFVAADETIEGLRLSGDGARLAYTTQENGGATNIRVTDSTGAAGPVFSDVYEASTFGFLDDTELVYGQENGGTTELVRFDTSDLTVTPSRTVLIGGINNLQNLDIRTGDSSTNQALLAFEDRGIGRVSLYEVNTLGSNPSYLSQLLGEDAYNENTESISDVQVARPAAGDTSPRLVLQGDLSETTGDDDDRLVERFVTSRTDSSSRFSSQVSEISQLFSGEVDLRQKPANFRLLADLEELVEQIDTNLEITRDMQVFVGENLDLVRATGLAMLDISDRADSLNDAELVAAELRKAIRSQERQAAAAHGENLFDIAAAAIALDDSSFTVE